MMRRVEALVAFAAVMASFTLALFFWRRIILIHCHTGASDPEGAANCLQIHMTNFLPVCVLFAVSAPALLVTILRLNRDSTGE